MSAIRAYTLDKDNVVLPKLLDAHAKGVISLTKTHENGKNIPDLFADLTGN